MVYDKANFEKVKQALQVLRPILESDSQGKSLEWFDEFVRETEFGLALHVICDYILKPNSSAPSDSAVAQIRELHKLMEMHDSCAENLRAKQAQTPVR